MACNCPQGYQLVGTECVKIAEIPAVFSGISLKLLAGSGTTSSTGSNVATSGLNLLEDITNKPKPIKLISAFGGGAPSIYTDNLGNSINTTIPGNGTKSKLWGATTTEGACYNPSFTPYRYNLASIKTYRQDPTVPYNGPTGMKLEFCTNIPVTKQYMLMVAPKDSPEVLPGSFFKVYLNGVLTFSYDFSSPAMDAVVPISTPVFPIVLSAGDLKITVETVTTNCTNCYIDGIIPPFAIDIYNLTLPELQSTLINPVTAFPNCGNIPSDIDPYILFSTKDYRNTIIPNLFSGSYTCPGGGTLIPGDCGITDYCNGLDYNDTLPANCYCYKLIACDGSTILYTSDIAFETYLNSTVSVTSNSFTGCVIVKKLQTACAGVENSVQIQQGQCSCDAYYTLNDCCTNEPLTSGEENNLVVIKFSGDPTFNNVYPGEIEDLIITGIGWELIDFQGCFKLTSTDPADEFYRFENIEILDTVQTCQECQACPVYYTLNDCCTNEPYKYDNQIYYIEYEGFCYPETCPNEISSLIITSITIEAVEDYITGCYKLTEVSEPPQGSLITSYGTAIGSVETVATCEECQDCSTPTYQLEDCSNSNNVVTTCSDLSNYINSVITLRNCPETCWKVSLAEGCDSESKPLDDIIISAYPPVEKGKICNYNLVEINGTCILQYIIYINNTAYTFNNNNTFNLVAAINGLNLGVASITDDVLTIVGDNNYGNLIYVLTQLCSETGQNIIIEPICEVNYDFDCESCLPKPIVPVPAKASPRIVQPGYFIKNPCLTTEYVEKVNCNFGNQVYDQMISIRYGINSCCEVDVNKWDIKKQIVDYTLMTIPKEEVHPERPCYCYTVTVLSGTATFKYISCDGIWTSVTLTESIGQYCSKNKPQIQCAEPGVVYEITISNAECESNADCTAPCYCYNISSKAGAAVYEYISCEGKFTKIDMLFGQQVNVCAKENSVKFVSGINTPGGITKISDDPCTSDDDCIPTPCYCYLIGFSNEFGSSVYQYTTCENEVVTLGITFKDEGVVCAKENSVQYVSGALRPVTKLSDNTCSVTDNCNIN